MTPCSAELCAFDGHFFRSDEMFAAMFLQLLRWRSAMRVLLLDDVHLGLVVRQTAGAVFRDFGGDEGQPAPWASPNPNELLSSTSSKTYDQNDLIVRKPLDKSRLETFLETLGRASHGPGRVYLTGGSSALLYGWRESTVDVDLFFSPEPSKVFEAIPRLKNELDLNIELASPKDFVPELEGWRERSVWIVSHHDVDFFHFDFYMQALSKVERNFRKDQFDVENMIEAKLVEPSRLLALATALTDAQWARFPSLEPTRIIGRIETLVEPDE